MATLYHPRNQSLNERIQGFRASLDALRQVEASQQLLNEKSWSQTLGDREELDSAYNLCRDSLNMAIQFIKPGEVRVAVSEGLLNETDAKCYTQIQRKSQIEATRSQNTNSPTKGREQ